MPVLSSLWIQENLSWILGSLPETNSLVFVPSREPRVCFLQVSATSVGIRTLTYPGLMVTTTTLTVVTMSTTQSSLGLSSLIFVMKINVIQPNRIWTRFKKCLPPYLTETLIMITKSGVITEHMALPIAIQIETGSC